MKKMIVTLATAGLLAVGLGSWSDGNAAAAAKPAADWSSSVQKPKVANATYVVRYQYPYGGCPSYMLYQGVHLWLQWGYSQQGGQYVCQFAGWV